MTLSNTSFIHFNDVYDVEKSPRFVTAVKSARKDLLVSSSQEGAHADGNNTDDNDTQQHHNHHHERNVITVFSGDAFSPSIMSTILRGQHMVPVLNALDIDVACLGNHDLDFGLQQFRELKMKCNFPWMCSNAWDAVTDEPLGGCEEYVILDYTEKGGAKLLVVGLVEEAWLDTLSSCDPQEIIFEQPADFVKRRIPELKDEHGPFDAIVAVTHQRMPNDVALVKEAGGNGKIDIILGGHDHHYEDTVINNVRILNSGCDFKSFTTINVLGRDDQTGALQSKSQRVNVSPEDDEPDEEVMKMIQQSKEAVGKSMDNVVGRTRVPLDARFTETRRGETNIGNFLAELMVRGTGADIALLNAGTIRADRFIEKGEITMRDLMAILPYPDGTKVVEVTAERLLLALENSLSKYPACEGRFPCVDGMRFAFDPSKPPGSRVVPGSVYVRDRPLVRRRSSQLRGQKLSMIETEDDMHAANKVVVAGVPTGFSPLDASMTFSLVSTAYLIKGKDGFDKAFNGAPVIQEEDQCPLIPTLLQNIFTELRTLAFWKDTTTSEGAVLKAATKFKRLVRRSVADPYAINPKVDGRIKNVEVEDLMTTIGEVE